MRYAILAAAAALGLVGTAHATEEIVTVTGTVASGTDPDGFFGPKGADLTGQTFTAVLAYNIAAGAEHDTTYAGIDGVILGGMASSTADAFSFTINGLSDYFRRGPVYSDVVAAYAPYQTTNYFYVQTVRQPDQGFVATFDGLSSPASASSPFNAGAPTYSAGGYGDGVEGLDLTLTPTAATLTETNDIYPSPVPEPASWALALVGFGLAGVAMRRHRSLYRLV